MKFFRHAAKRSSKPTSLKANLLRFETLETRRLMSVNHLLGAVAPPTSGENAPDYSSGVVPAVSVFAGDLPFASKPGAPAMLFLDFDGHHQVERVGMDEWQDVFVPGDHGWDNIWTEPFDRDGNPDRYSPEEQQMIQSIWAAVAEDYAPFNINVTTSDPDPGGLHPERPYMRMVISGDADFRSGYGQGGFAEYDAYANEDGANTGYAFSRSSATGNDYPLRFIAETVSHEAGHAFGLDHYGTNYGTSLKAPIMRENGAFGVGANAVERGVWWGDDMDIIANSDNGFGYRPDDHVNEFAGATWLNNKGGVDLHGAGVIENRYDRDMFRFEHGGGTLFITLEGAKDAFGRSVANLDAAMRLYYTTDHLYAYGSETGLNSSIVNMSAPAGTYYIRVASQREVGDVGQYTLKVHESVGPRIVAANYYQIEPNLMGLLLTFNEPVLAGTFTTHDVAVTAGARVKGVTLTSSDSKQFLVKITPPPQLASFSVSVGPIISDRFGNLMDQNQDGSTGTSADVFRWTSLTNAKTKAVTTALTESVTTLETAKSGRTLKPRTK